MLVHFFIYICVSLIKLYKIKKIYIYNKNSFHRNYSHFQHYFLRFGPGKRKRSLQHQEHVAVLREMQVADMQEQEQNRTQRDRHLQMILEEARQEARQARAQEAALRVEEHSQTAAFNQAFLDIMGRLVQAMSGRRE